MDDAVWSAAMRDARRWEAWMPENFFFDLEGEMLTPSDMIFVIMERLGSFVPPVHLRWSRLRRHARVVGGAARCLLQIYDEVTYRPQHAGAKRSREHFLSLCA